MSDKKDAEKNTSKEDPELDDLLNSALEDFSKKPATEAKDTTVAKADEAGESQWTEEYLKKAASEFESNLSQLMSSLPEGIDVSPNQIAQNAQKIAEAASQVISNIQPSEQSDDFTAALTQTLQNLSLDSERIQSMVADQDMSNVYNGLGEDERNSFLPMLQSMMQSVLSKEVLYPSLKDMLDSYPKYLQDNKDKLEPEQYDKYVKQQQLMSEICTVFESEGPNDPEDIQRDRFGKILSMMQRMQDLGQPPTELVGDMGPGLTFDPQGNPVLPDGALNDLNSQCALM